MQPVKKFLQTITPLSETDWQLAEKFFKPEHFKKGEHFLQVGDHCQKVSFVVSGLFKLFYLSEGEEKIMLFFSEGQFVTDYFGYLTRTPSIRPIQALEDSMVYSIAHDNLQQLFDTSKQWDRLGRMMAERAYIISVQRANRLLHDDYDTRFATFMQEYPSLLQRVPQYMIASYLNMTPETFSRVKKRMTIQGKLKTSIHSPIDPKLI